MEEFYQNFSGVLGTLSGFFTTNLKTIIALVLFLLSFQLFRLVIVGMMQRAEPPDYRRVSVLILPGTLFSLAGIILLANLENVAPIIIYLLLTLLIGYALAHLGYRLFDKSAPSTGEPETVWEDHEFLFKKALPGAFFAAFGALIVFISLLQGYGVIDVIQALEIETQRKVLTLVDTRLQEALKLLGEHLQQSRGAGQ